MDELSQSVVVVTGLVLAGLWVLAVVLAWRVANFIRTALG